MALLRRIGLCAALGFVFYFWSERVFWSRWRVEDNAGSLGVTWFAYSVAAAVCLVAISEFRARNIHSLFMVGALLGWLIEGVLAMTFFGTADIPFPLTIAWTGLAWHALISFTIGWALLQQALSRSARETALLSAALGVFWGVWSISWDAASGGVAAVSGKAFALHAAAATAGLALALGAIRALRASQFRASRAEKIVLAAVVLSFFLGVTATTVGWLAFVTLPPLFGIIWLALRANRAAEEREHFLVRIDRAFPWTRALYLILIPSIAVIVREACLNAGLSLQTNVLVFAVTAPGGALFFVVSVWRLSARRRRGAPSAFAPPRR
jgi:hypothetical protein